MDLYFGSYYDAIISECVADLSQGLYTSSEFSRL